MKAAVLGLLVLAVVAFAAEPVATVSSGSDFTLRGAKIETAGVPSWPLLAGDSIAAGTAPIRIRFQDGSVATLSPDSSAKVEQSDSGLLLRLLDGAMQFTGASNSTLSVFSGQTAVTTAANVQTSVTAGSGPSAGSRGTISNLAPSGLGSIIAPNPINLSRK